MINPKYGIDNIMHKLMILLLAMIVAGSVPAAAQEQAAGKPKAYLVSNAHLDTQWNWDIQTTIREYVRNTLFQNLLLLREYPDYVFNFEGGVKYSWMKEYYPAQYEQLKSYIHSGRWHICGASWDATDTLIPSIESAIRNVMLGQEFYRSEFGVESTDIFLPDCFGFGWTLPTVAAHCGLIGFSSQKLGWRNLPFHDGKKYPFLIGLWQGIDGARIGFAHGYNYGQRWKDESLSDNPTLLQRASESSLNRVYHYYGTGDVGGSPTLASVSAVEKSVREDGAIAVISATSDQLYKDLLPFAEHPELPVYDGELLMDVHGTGCYTSQAAMKLYNRQNELLGDAAERASVAAALLGTAEYPAARLTENWRRVIFHQFHDDLTGTSIPRAYEFSWNDELIALGQFADILTDASSAVSERMDTRTNGTPVLFYNALGYPATDIVELTLPAAGYPQQVTVTDHNGRRMPAQPTGYADGKVHLLVEASVPANGFAVYGIRLAGATRKQPRPIPASSLENSRYKIRFNGAGDVVSLFDKQHGKELVQAGKALRLALFTENDSFSWPAWEVLKKTIDAEPVSIDDQVCMTLVEQGPLRQTLCIEKRYGDSRFRQYVRLYEGELAGRIDFFNEVWWQSTPALLKAEFPLSVSNELATYDLGVGSVQRGNNRDNAYEVYAQQWADLTDRSGDYGITVMNDSKYGWDKPDDNTLRLTLLHTPKTQKFYAYQDHQDQGYHTFTYSLVGHTGALHVEQMRRQAEVLNQRIKAFAVPRHEGVLGKSYSLAASDNDHVVIKALKRAESSDEYVVRIYEAGGKADQKARITFPVEILSAVSADGTEKSIAPAVFAGRQLDVAVPRNGIATYKVRLAAPEVTKNVYEPLALTFDKRCFSWNEFSGEADFEGGYSYAMELIPAELTIDRVPFRLENHAQLNGMQCRGDTIRLPQTGPYNRLYLLAAAATDGTDVQASFRADNSSRELVVPNYTGFVGQWGHTGHTKGYLKPAEVAYVGTHRHSSEGDHPYEFTYMFKLAVDLPANATQVVLPDRPEIVIFAATLAAEPYAPATALSPLFRTSIADDATTATAETEGADRLNFFALW